MINPLEIVQAATAKGFNPRGIGLASSYIRTALGAHGVKGFAELAGISDQKKIADAIKQAESDLVFTGTGSKFVSWSVKDAGQLITKGDEPPARENKTELTPGSIMDFECVISTKNKDRDGDELNPLGCKIDPAMPLLWQHMAFQPIGKMYAVLEQSAERIKGHFGIADTALGRDAATLVAFGALRISQGFKPTKFEMLRGGDYDILGYVIHEWEMHETSLVSVPANAEAVITAFSGAKLHHPMVKSWAKGLYDDRPVIVPTGGEIGGGSIFQKGGNTVVKIYTGTKSKKPKPATPAATAPATKGKDDKPDDKPANDGAGNTPPNGDSDNVDNGDDAATKNPMLGDMVAALEKMVNDESVPTEARARLAVCHTILAEASGTFAANKEAISAALDACDVGQLKELVDGVSAGYIAAIGKASDEMKRVAEIDGIPDSFAELNSNMEMLASLHKGDDDATGGTEGQPGDDVDLETNAANDDDEIDFEDDDKAGDDGDDDADDKAGDDDSEIDFEE